MPSMPSKLKKRITGALLIGLLTAPAAHALSIGETSLRSFLMQPLDAEIQLQGTEGLNAADLKVRVGNPGDFNKLGIDRDAFTAKLKLNVEKREGRWVIHATTDEPIQQPYLQFPLRLRSGQLRLVKEITLLLDPPRRIERPSTAPAPAQDSGAAQRATRNQRSAGETYRVKPGDTLWPIADRLRSRDVSNYQMMIALQRANPQAFANGNINRIRSGSILQVPSTEEVLQIGRREASDAFWRQQREWKSGIAAAAPVQATAEPSAPATPAREEVVETRPLLPAAPSAGDGEADASPRLEVLPPPEAIEDVPPEEEVEAVQREILLNEEQARSRELEQTNIRHQIASLQAQMDQMQALLALKDQQIAALQSIIETRELAQRLDQAGQTQTAKDTREPGPGFAPSVAAPPAAPLQQPAVKVTTDQALQAREKPDDGSTSLWGWLWAIIAALVIMLLALLLKRRSGNEENHGDLPLGAYPEVSHAAPRPYAGEPGHEEMPAPTPAPTPEEVPLTSVPPAQESGDVPPVPAEVTPPTETIEEEIPAPAEPIRSVVPEKPMEEEAFDLDLGLDEDKNLPELDDVLIPSRDEAEAETGEPEDKVAAFWDELDTSELGETETQPEQTDEDQSLEILLEMARAYVELGDRDEAVAILQQALSAAEDEEKRARIQDALDEI